MSVCLESSSSSVVLPAQVVGKLTPDSAKGDDAAASSNPGGGGGAPTTAAKTAAAAISKGATSSADLQAKVSANSSVITVVNAPITVVKSIGGAATTPFSLNPSTTNPSTITLVNASPAKSDVTNNGGLPVAPVNDKQQSAMHNVFVKKSAPAEGGGISVPDMPQSHKLLTATSFPPTNILQKLSPITKTQNGQRSGKVKVLGGQHLAPAEKQASNANANPGPSNVILNKNQRVFQQKVVGNGATKYLNKLPSDANTNASKRILFHGKSAAGQTGALEIKPLPQPPSNAHHRPAAGLKTIPPQRSVGGANKPNYIGKHAVQAQKIKPKLKPKVAAAPHPTPAPLIKSPVRPAPDQSAQTIFNQALTAQILETLSDKDCAKPHPSNSYGMKYEPPLPKPETTPASSLSSEDNKRRPITTLDTLSFVCHAVLLDHNYNATLPSEPPPKPAVPVPTTPPTNGAQHQHQHPHPHPHPHQQFSPIPAYPSSLPNAKQRNRTTSQSTPVLLHPREDDAASDISEHKEESEGEETDTAPEAEAVANEGNDRYGDYVTRCICGFIHDDGFMIECDKCKVWQHVRCVVKTKKVPDDYFCEECDKRPVDKQKARALQQQWMREIQERDAKLRKEQLAMTDSDSSDAEALNKNRRKEPPRRQRRDSLNNRARPGKRKERKVPNKRTKAKPPAKSDDEKVPQIRQWIENYEEAMTNHYSPDLRSRISSARLNGAHSEIPGGVDLSVNKCRVQSNPNASVKFLVASVSLPMGTPVIELRGKYMLSTQHRSTTRQQRPGPFLFFHTLIKDTEVCVDTRTYGNCARFVRRSCTPNAKLQHIFEKGILHLFIVTTKSVEKGSELTIRHESHDLAAAQLTDVPCACVNPEYCALIKGHRRHNGDIQSPPLQESKKRRGRHSRDPPTSPTVQPAAVLPSPVASTAPETTTEIIKEEKVEVKEEDVPEEKKEEPEEIPEVKEAVPEVDDIKEETKEEAKESDEDTPEPPKEIKEEVKEEPETTPQKEPQPIRQARHISTRRASRHSQDQSEAGGATQDNDKKPMSREERKMAAIVKAIERLEKQEARRQEHQAKQANRREPDSVKDDGPKAKRRKRKGRARTTSTTSTRRSRLDSAESVHSSDDTLLSPPSEAASPSKAAGMLLALSNGECRKSPDRLDSSNSAHSSPETPLSAACLMVAAAVEPLEPGFKFPKTKKVLMNEWLNKSDVVQPASAISPSSLTPHVDANTLFAGSSSPAKCPNTLAQAGTFCDQQRSGSAKKRWLRQAISEDQCDSPPQADAVAPPKKRKLPRESLSCESSPPTTPTTNAPPQVEIVTHQDEDGTPPIESDASLSELVSEMRQEFGCIQLPQREPSPPPPPPPPVVIEEHMETRIVSFVTTPSIGATTVTPTVSLSPIVNPTTTTPTRAILDPRLAPRISTSELVGTVEKTLSFLGYEEKKQSEAITPAKRKLSITEYRQRKKLNNNDKATTNTDDVASITEESNSSQSPKLQRTRSNSVSSATSATTSDDEQANSSNQTPPVVEVKALSAFNSEPTELEKQREKAASLRLRLALGLNSKNTIPPSVDTILKCELPTTMTSKSTPLVSPTFPIPGRDESLASNSPLKKSSPMEESNPSNPSPPRLEPEVEFASTETTATKDDDIAASMDEETQDGGTNEQPLEERKVLYYTPDDEEVGEATTYVPPFNNPLYPNTSYTYGSVIDDDALYEGRNPSPPPNLRANPS